MDLAVLSSEVEELSLMISAVLVVFSLGDGRRVCCELDPSTLSARPARPEPIATGAFEPSSARADGLVRHFGGRVVLFCVNSSGAGAVPLLQAALVKFPWALELQ